MNDPTPEHATPVYTEGVCADGAAILCDGAMMQIADVLATLNAQAVEIERLRVAAQRTIPLPGQLGRYGLGMAADSLEDEADRMTQLPIAMQSIQMVADWLRKTAATFQEAT